MMFGRMEPSVTAGVSSKEAGVSSSVSGVEAEVGLVGVSEGEVVTVEAGAEPGEGGVKPGGSSLKPGLFGDGAEGERARLDCRGREGKRVRVQLFIHTSRGHQSSPGLTWSFSIRAEFLLTLDG